MRLWILRPVSLPVLLLSIISSTADTVNDSLRILGTNSNIRLLPRFDDIARRNADIKKRLVKQNINGVRKMSDDEGEKFFLDYWSFDDLEGSDISNSSGNLANELNDVTSPGSIQFRPAFSVHTDERAESFYLAERYSGSARRALSMLLKRDFKCPTGTFACTAINQPDSCCSDGDTCQSIQDTGLGSVGCCLQGETCLGSVSSCGSGYTSCPSSLGGGCCIPGYECVSGGCAFVSIYTVTERSTTFVVSSTITTSAVTSTMPTPLSSTSEPLSTTMTNSTETSTSVSLTPPVRPTTDSVTTVTSVPSGASVCPTGFYACSAVYHGGCCRVGRDCDMTSCPTTSSTTIINSDGITIAVPTGSAATTASGSTCANGWFSCAATLGGGCCPSGFACGSSCTASVSGTGSATATVAKSELGRASGQHDLDSYYLGAYALGVLYFLL